jgi:hypothetical protein
MDRGASVAPAAPIAVAAIAGRADWQTPIRCRSSAKKTQKIHEIAEIPVKAEAPCGQRHLRRVSPFHKVKVVILRQSDDHVIEQNGAMAR